MADRLNVDVGTDRTTALVYRAAGARRGITLLLAHGAGAPQQSAFMVRFAGGLASRGIDVVTFNFLYMEQRRKAPDRTDRLESCYRAVEDAVRAADGLERNARYLGGKSMGGRIASHLAAAESDDEAGAIAGLVLLGYPLHPPGKPEQLRSAHLARIRAPMLFVQGSRDPFGSPEELRAALVNVRARVTVHIVEGGDHSLVPPKGEGVTVDQVYEDVLDAIARWTLPASR